MIRFSKMFFKRNTDAHTHVMLSQTKKWLINCVAFNIDRRHLISFVSSSSSSSVLFGFSFHFSISKRQITNQQLFFFSVQWTKMIEHQRKNSVRFQQFFTRFLFCSFHFDTIYILFHELALFFCVCEVMVVRYEVVKQLVDLWFCFSKP